MPIKLQNVGRVTGWMVTVWREGRFKKFFDDRRGGSRVSLRRAYRAKLLRSLPPSGAAPFVLAVLETLHER